MPTYDYFCEANGQTLEVKHGMKDSLNTWGELCAKLGIASGETPQDVPVKRLATGGQVVKSGSLKNNVPPCMSGGGCSGGGCGV